ncbi:hypothetical protein GLYMA_14G173600v4 [Glycine max]|uniref:Uncharacterized protein n=1 Tax=Glycine max TaxID=3847 RepID=K7M7M4_SOYBN|nr:hypothetical protein GYH30_040357 [Glycine max]KRH16728.1 hypothetical protein GLYMA_14G173600v4 [Glycine max]
MGWFLFLVLSFLLSHFPSQTSSLMPFCNHDDASALLSFKSSFTLNSSSDSSGWCESPYPKTESWENGTNCCLWEGVSCDTKSGHVIGIDLSCSCLQGEFHPNTTLFKLIHLKKLNLAFNDFSNSPMPNGFGDHVALTHLNLSHSAFSGVIPSKISLLSKLVSLDLSFLGMRIEAATLENVIVNATDIREVTLDFLNMSTIEPSSLSLLVNFSSSLVSLSLGDTGLQGKLANNILCLPNLQKLDLSVNLDLEGELPEFNRSTPLRYLDLSYTGFSGKLPNTINHLESLNFLGLESCDFEGPIPVFLFNLTQLKFLDLGGNNFSGEIPSSLSNLRHLTFINLFYNSFTGHIVQYFGNITQVYHLNLGWNNFSVLDLRRNNLSGMIPKTYLEIEALETMNFNGNQLEGPLPRSVVKCKQLRVLDLGENNIHDKFPTFLESLQQLQVLVLRANRFNGTINCMKLTKDFPMLRVFDISNNNFSGNLPTACLEDFKGMMVNVDNSMQYMTGENYSSRYYDSVVVTMKGNIYELQRILTTFTTIDLSNNRFGGVIPAIIGDLKSLKGLNLSHNRITGVIPKNFGGLDNLEWLDLSSNMLMGEIPKTLTNLHFLSVLNLSQNQLVGMIPTGKQFDTFQNDSYEGNQGLCGLPLSKSCHNDEKLPTESATFQHDEEFRFGWKPVAIGYACGGVFGILLGYIVFFYRKPEWSISFVECILNQRVRKKSNRSNANTRRYNQRR